MLITICRFITASYWPLQRHEGVLCVHLPGKSKLLWKSQLDCTRIQAKCEFTQCFAKASFTVSVSTVPAYMMILCWCSKVGPKGCYKIWHQSNITQLEEKWLFLWGSCNKLGWLSTESFSSTVCCWNTHWLRWEFRSPDVKPINAANVYASYWKQLTCYKESQPAPTADDIFTSQISCHRTRFNTPCITQLKLFWMPGEGLVEAPLDPALVWWFFCLNLSTLGRLNCGFSACKLNSQINF